VLHERKTVYQGFFGAGDMGRRVVFTILLMERA
jgi:hypothetical protein